MAQQGGCCKRVTRCVRARVVGVGTPITHDRFVLEWLHVCHHQTLLAVLYSRDEPTEQPLAAVLANARQLARDDVVRVG